MASIFDQPKPSRIRIETPSSFSVDEIVPCFFAIYPDPAGTGKVSVAETHQSRQQLVAMVEAAVRFGIIHGVMNDVMRSLTGSPLVADLESHGHLPPNTPPDDLPPHLRGGRKPGP